MVLRTISTYQRHTGNFAKLSDRILTRLSTNKDLQRAIAATHEPTVATTHNKIASFYEPKSDSPFQPIAGFGPFIKTSHGAIVYDTGGYGMLGFGHNYQPILDALSRPQVMANIMTPNNAQIEFTEKLDAEIGQNRLWPETEVFAKYFCLNSGSEAVALALRMSLQKGDSDHDIYTNSHATSPITPTKQGLIVNLESSFHGRLDLGAKVSDSSRKSYKTRLLESALPNVRVITIPWNDMNELKKISELQSVFDLKAVVFEPVSGEGCTGLTVSPEFYDGMYRLTRETGAMMIADSVQAGLRCTGYLSVVDYPEFSGLEAKPDMEIYSKALNGGQYPLSVIACNDRAYGKFEYGTYGNTMTANPRALTVGSVVLDEMPKYQENVRVMGQYLLEELQSVVDTYPEIAVDASGRGLLCAIKLSDAFDVNRVEYLVRMKGLNVIHAAGNRLRFTPVFGVTKVEVDVIVSILRETFDELVLGVE